ncbi:MAG: FMN-binding protein, partial [Campylobacterota bacterium]
PFIAQNKLEALEKAINRIIPDADSRMNYRLSETDQFEQLAEDSQSGQLVYTVYNKQKNLLGFVIKAQGRGYQDTIELIYAYQPGKQIITGLVILANRETPGLGAKIVDDPDFHGNFKQLDVQLNSDKSSLLHAVEVIKPGSVKQAWQIDAITGATISAKAVAKIIHKSASKMLPIINQNMQDFNHGSKR